MRTSAAQACRDTRTVMPLTSTRPLFSITVSSGGGPSFDCNQNEKKTSTQDQASEAASKLRTGLLDLVMAMRSIFQARSSNCIQQPMMLSPETKHNQRIQKRYLVLVDLEHADLHLVIVRELALVNQRVHLHRRNTQEMSTGRWQQNPCILLAGSCAA